MASSVIAGAAMAVSLGWLPFVHHKPAEPHQPRRHHDKHMPAAAVPGEVGGARYVNEGGVVLVPAKVLDRGPFPFILDTGAAHSSIDARTAFQIQVGFWGENASPPSTAEEPSARRLAATTFNIGDAPLFSAAPHALYKPLNLVGKARGRIGRDAMGGYIVRVDPRYRMVTVHDPLRFTKPVNSVALPMTITEDGIFVPVTLRMKDGSAVVRHTRLDTGLAWTMADDAATVSNLASVDLGGWSVPQTAGQGPGVGAPAIGMGLLNGFIVTIDAPDHILYLQSAGRYRPDFKYTARVKADGKPAKPKKKKRFIVF
jgi:hypothetical protein